MKQAKDDLLEVARSLAKKGEIDAAVRTLLRAGAFEEAATTLVAVQRFADAGHLLVDAIGVGTSLFDGLDAERKKLAVRAAVCFAQAGETRRAIEIYLALGDRIRAADTLDKAGDKVGAAKLRAEPQGRSGAASEVGAIESLRPPPAGKAAAQRLERAGQLQEAFEVYLQARDLAEAARVAHQMGRFVEAAKIYEDIGRSYEAAVCYSKAGDSTSCLGCLVRIPSDHARYRTACLQAIKLAAEANQLDFHIEHFLTRFLVDAPREPKETEALYVLARLYRAHDFRDSAADAYGKILAAHPDGYRDAADKLAAIESEARDSRMVFEAIVREDMSFRSEPKISARPAAATAPLPDLPDLPPLDGGAGQAQLPLAETVHGVAASAPVQQPHAMATQLLAQAAAPDAETIAEGQVVVGRYRIESKLGEGGMAVVYRATDLELGEAIAMKVFMEAPDEELIGRFKQELSLSRQITHPNVVRLYDMGTAGTRKFITMELLDGRDLESMLSGTPMDLARAIGYLIQACEGLSAAHAIGVIHRDVKPANFFVTSGDVLKVMDFGIAKAKSKSKLTQAGFFAGTPEYMSPEQITAFGSVTHLSDLYSLGIVAYQLVTGTLPFQGDLVQLLHAQASVEPEPPTKRNPDLPAELEDVILRLMAKDPASRIQSCRDLAGYLAELKPRKARS